jgi:hypothetical protein
MPRVRKEKKHRGVLEREKGSNIRWVRFVYVDGIVAAPPKMKQARLFNSAALPKTRKTPYRRQQAKHLSMSWIRTLSRFSGGF